MPEVTFINGTILPGTHEFPQVAIPSGIKNIEFQITCPTFTGAGGLLVVDLDESRDGGVNWLHHSRAERPSGTFFEQGGAVSTALSVKFKFENIASTTRRLRGRIILSGLSLTTVAKIIYT